jgi:hypothetical protein
MYVHALHTVHALPDLRVAAGRLRDGVHLIALSRSTCVQTQKGLIQPTMVNLQRVREILSVIRLP